MRKLVFFPEIHSAPRIHEAIQKTREFKKEGKDVRLLLEGILHIDKLQKLGVSDLEIGSVDHPVLLELSIILNGVLCLSRVQGFPFTGDVPNARYMIHMLPNFPEVPSPKNCLDVALANMWRSPIQFSEEFLAYLEQIPSYLDSLKLFDLFQHLNSIQLINANGGLPEILNVKKLQDCVIVDPNKFVSDFESKLYPAVCAIGTIRDLYIAHSINQSTREVSVIDIGVNHVNDSLVDILKQLGFKDMEAFEYPDPPQPERIDWLRRKSD